MIIPNPTLSVDSKWHQLAAQVLEGIEVSFEQAEEILASTNDELLDLIGAAFRLRKRYFAKTVQLYFLVNAKSGLCPEDCGTVRNQRYQMRRLKNTACCLLSSC